MAENVIRRDIIELSVQSDLDGLNKLNSEMSKVKQSVSGGINNEVNKLVQGLKNLKSSISGLGSDSGLSKLKDDMEMGGAAIDVVKDKFNAFKSSVKGLATHPIKTFDNRLLKIQMSAARSAIEFKKLSRIKVDNLKTGLTKIKTGLTDGQKGARGFSNALKNIGKISVAKLVSGVNKIKSHLQKAIPKADQFTKKLKNAAKVSFSKLGSGIKSVASSLGGSLVAGAKVMTGALAAGAAGVTALSAKGVLYNSEIETYQKSFETMTGSAEKAQQTVSQLQSMGAATPFEMPELAETTQLLMNYGFTADDAISRMSMLGDISQGDAEKMNRVATAYGQMSSAGKVQLEDVKQMIEAGFNPLQEISQSTGESMSSLYDRISKGTLAVDEITASMQRSTSVGGRYFQSMQKQSQTFSGQMSTLKDNANQLLGGLTSSLQKQLAGEFLPGMNSSLSGLTEAFEQGGIDGFLNALPNALQGALNSVMKLIQTMLPTIMNVVVTALSSVVSSLAEALPALIPTVVDAMLNLIQALLDILQTNGPQIVTALVSGLNQAVQGLLAMSPQLLDVGMKILNSLGQGIAEAAPSLILAAVDALIGLIDAFINNMELLIQTGVQLLNGIIQGVIQAIPKLIQAIPKIITGLVSALLNNLQTVIQAGIQLIVALTVGIIQAIPQLIAMIPQIFSGLWDAITSINWMDLGVSIIKGIWDGIKSIGKSLWNGVKGLFGGGDKKAEAELEGNQVGSSYTSGIQNGVDTSSLNNTGLEASTSFANGLTSGQGAVTTAAQGLSVQTQNAMSIAAQGTTKSAEEVSAQITGSFAEMTTKLQELPAQLTGILEPIDGIVVKLSDLPALFAQTFSTLPENMGSVEAASLRFKGALEPLPQAIEPVIPGIMQLSRAVISLSHTFPMVAEAASQLLTTVTGLVEKLTELSQSVDTVITAFSGGFKIVLTTVNNGLHAIKDSIARTDLGSMGMQMINGLIVGMNSRKAAVISTARSIAKAINEEYRKIQDIHSPSGVWESYGKYQIQGNIQGMKNEAPHLQATVQEIGSIAAPYAGYTPETTAISHSTQSTEEHTTYAPTFTITINGSLTDRETVRQTKQKMFEIMDEYFQNLARRNKPLRQV